MNETEDTFDISVDPLTTTVPSSTPRKSHMQTYTAGEDGSRLAAAAKELGLQQARQPRRPVRRSISLGETNLYRYYLALDASTEQARMRSVMAFNDSDTEDSSEDDGEVDDPHASGIGGDLTSAVLGIIKGMVGPAILYLPHGFASAGYAVAIPIMLLSTVLFLFSSSCLLEAWKMETEQSSSASGEQTALLEQGNGSVRSRRRNRMLSYPELARRALGNVGETLVKTGIALMQSGVCLTYLIFVPQNLHTSMYLITGLDWSPRFWLLVMVAAQIPLSWIRDIRRLTPTNLAANCMILYGLCVCLGFAMGKSLFDGDKSPHVNLWNHVHHLKPFASGWFLFIGTSVLLFEGSITLLVPLQESVTTEEQRAHFPQVYQRVILGIICFYAIFGLTCWMAFGDDVKIVLTTSLPPGILATTVQLAYSLAVMCTFPLQNFPALEITTRTILSMFGSGSKDGRQRNVVSSILVALLAVVAVCTMESLDMVVSLMGSLLGCPIAFVFPPLIHSQLLLKRTNLATSTFRTRLCLNGLVVFLGIVAMAIASITTLATWT